MNPATNLPNRIVERARICARKVLKSAGWNLLHVQSAPGGRSCSRARAPPSAPRRPKGPSARRSRPRRPSTARAMRSTPAGPPARRPSRRPRPHGPHPRPPVGPAATGTSASSTPTRAARSPARPASRPTSWRRASSRRARSSASRRAASAAPRRAPTCRSTSSRSPSARPARCRSSTSTRPPARSKRGCRASASTSPSTATRTPSRSSCTAPPTSARCARPGSRTTCASAISRRARRPTRAADSKFAASNPKTQLPSGSNQYRHLADYNLELKQLAMRYPGLVKELTLNHQSVEGRDVNGIEITQNPNAQDGKAIFLQLGVHHAREWPSSEHAIEFAYDLLTNYGTSSRTTDLVNTTRTIVVPIVNPDGFNLSREAQHAGFSASFGAVRLRDEAQELPDLDERRRRSTWAAPAATTRRGACAAPTPTATTAACGAAAARARTGATTRSAATRRSRSPRSRTSASCSRRGR